MSKDMTPTEENRDLLALRRALAGMTKASDRRSFVIASQDVAEALSRTISSIRPLVLLSAKSEIGFAIQQVQLLPSPETKLDVLVFAHRMVEGASCALAKRIEATSGIETAA